MKTNQVLTRKMGDFDVNQRTKDGMFNATSLIKQWNESRLGKKKDIDDFLNNKSTKEYIDVILYKENLNTQKSGYLKIISTARGKNGGTWMHPFLFIDFAMWLNPGFKYEVIKFVYDKLIEYRNEAGDTYREMCDAIASISKKGETAENITKIARAINIVVFGKHEREARNKNGEEFAIKELVELQKQITNLIGFGFIKNFESTRAYLLNVWQRKNQPKELISARS